MPKPRLTKKECRLAAEVKQLLSRLNLNPDEIVTTTDREYRSGCLEFARMQIIRSAVILKYVEMDDHLNCIMYWHFFGKKRPFLQLWKTKRFKSFNYYILEKLYLLQKLDLVENVYDIPSWVGSDIRKLNDLRNGLAHSFRPWNRRRKPEWKGLSVFSQEGFDRFMNDMEKLWEFFFEKIFGRSLEIAK